MLLKEVDYIIKIHWEFEQNGLIPIISAKGECPVYDLSIENMMANMAADMIMLAYDFKELPMQEVPQKTELLTVSFTLVFPSNDNLESFLRELQKR